MRKRCHAMELGGFCPPVKRPERWLESGVLKSYGRFSERGVVADGRLDVFYYSSIIIPVRGAAIFGFINLGWFSQMVR